MTSFKGKTREIDINTLNLRPVPKDPPMPEHRIYPRAEGRADVYVRVQSSPDTPDLEGKIFLCRLINVSMSGLMLSSDIPFPIGAYLELQVFFKHTSRKFWHHGNVVWMRKSEGSADFNHIGIISIMLTDAQFCSWQSEVEKLYCK